MLDDGLFPAPPAIPRRSGSGSRVPVIPDPDLPLSKRAQQRFWKHVVRGDDDRCWIWVGAISSPDGYGRFTWQHDRRRRTVSAHRVALRWGAVVCVGFGWRSHGIRSCLAGWTKPAACHSARAGLNGSAVLVCAICFCMRASCIRNGGVAATTRVQCHAFHSFLD